MASGWIKLHRKMLGSAVMRDDFLCRMWVWCLLKASHAEHTDPGRGIVRAGEFITGRFTGAGELNVHPSTFYRTLNKLSRMGNIRLKSNNRDTLVSIVNWRVFQAEEPPETPSPEQLANNRRTTGEQQMNTINTKNGRMEESPQPPETGGGVSESADGEIGWLVREWFHVYRGPKKVDLHKEVSDGFSELVRQGWNADAIKRAILDPTRTRTEWPSTFVSRLSKTKPAKPCPTPEEIRERTRRNLSRLDGAAAPEEIGAILDRMRGTMKPRLHREQPEAPES